jgi:hypothetical protein
MIVQVPLRNSTIILLLQTDPRVTTTISQMMMMRGKRKRCFLGCLRGFTSRVQTGARVEPSSKYFNAFGTNFFTSP